MSPGFFRALFDAKKSRPDGEGIRDKEQGTTEKESGTKGQGTTDNGEGIRNKGTGNNGKEIRDMGQRIRKDEYMDGEIRIRMLKWAEKFYGKYRVELIPKQGEYGLTVLFENGKAVITYEKPVQFFRGAGFVRQWLKDGLDRGRIQEKPVFEHLTYMTDCSRNAVCSVSWLEKLIPRLACMGYDRLMLYTEDTYEVEGEPFFGHFRGRYSKEELQELDDCAWGYGIELVPCIQTLAHLNAIFHWNVYERINDTGDILCSGSEETYELIDRMAASLAQEFHSRSIHIGMDEAELVGRGNYLKKYGYEERMNIMERHLRRVTEIFRKHGFHTFMMWSDMYFKILTNGGYYDSLTEIPENFAERIPNDVELVYWDYYTRDKEEYDRMLRAHRKMSSRIGFAGGAWKWTGFAPLNMHSMTASRAALQSCIEYGIQNVIVTGWGDNGGEAAQVTVLPVLALFAEVQYEQRSDDSWTAQRLRACTGADLEEFLLLDCLNLVPDNPAPGQLGIGPAKYLLYQDPLLGIFDAHVPGQIYADHFSSCAVRLREAEQKNGEYRYLFRTMASLAEVLELKADLGVRIRDAYHRKDRERLAQAAEECGMLLARIETFHNALREQWLTENKSFGLEIQDLRLGGLKERVRRTQERIRDYLSGGVSKIEELEEEALRLSPEGMLPGEYRWERIVTAGVI